MIPPAALNRKRLVRNRLVQGSTDMIRWGPVNDPRPHFEEEAE